MTDDRGAADIEIRSARTAGEIERTAVAAGRAFSAVPESDFRHRIVDAPALPVENTLLGFDGADLVTSLQLYDRRLWLAGAPVPVAGVGNVQTDPDRRGEGHASALLDHAKTFAVEKGYPLVALVGDPSFYSRYGWVPADAASTVVGEPEPVASHDRDDAADPDGSSALDHLDTPSKRWRPFDLDTDLDAIAAIHRAEYRGIDGSFNRYPALWADWVFEILADPADVSCYYEDGENGGSGENDGNDAHDEPTGYLVHKQGERGVACLEVGYRGTDRASFLTAAWNLLVEPALKGSAQKTGATNPSGATGPSCVRWDPPLETIGETLRAGYDLRSETMAERTGETPMLWAAPALLDAATGGAFDSAEAVAERVVGPDRWFPVLDKF